MTPDERDAVIDECIRAVLSVREADDRRPPADQEAADTYTGAACYRLLRLKTVKQLPVDRS